MTKIAIQTEPTAEPVTLLELRDHLEVIDPVKNEYAEALIKVARQSLEEMTWSAFVTQTWDQWFDGFASPLKLKKPPVASTVRDLGQDEQGASAGTHAPVTRLSYYYFSGKIKQTTQAKALTWAQTFEWNNAIVHGRYVDLSRLIEGYAYRAIAIR